MICTFYLAEVRMMDIEIQTDRTDRTESRKASGCTCSCGGCSYHEE
jgi:hypothetical protein